MKNIYKYENNWKLVMIKRNSKICRQCVHSYWHKKKETPKLLWKNLFKYCEIDRNQSIDNKKYRGIFTDLSGKWKKMTDKEFYNLNFLPTDCPHIMEHVVMSNHIKEKKNEKAKR